MSIRPEATRGTKLEFVASDQYPLHVLHCRPTGVPRGFLIGLHGIQSHSGWYTYSCGRLAEAGFDARFLDRRGSGQNAAERGHAPSAERLVADVVEFVTRVCEERDRVAPRAPVVLLAVSWGGKLATVVCARYPTLVDALVLLYPGLFAHIGPNPWQRFQLWLGELLGIRRKRVPIPLSDPALFTGNPDWQAFIRNDPLALHEVTTAFLYANRRLGHEAVASADALGLPLLLMLAGQDRIIDNAATRKFFGHVAAADKTLIEYPAAHHTLEFEPNRDKVFDDLIAWLKHVTRRRS